MSKDSRCVHAAQDALQRYIATNRNLDVLYSIPIHLIDRYDVWQCVFEKENEAYRVLQEKELRHTLNRHRDVDLKKYCPTLVICLLERTVEFNQPLNINDAINVVLDTIGDDILPALIEEAETSVARKREIISKYFKKDNEWVGYAKTVLSELKKHEINLRRY